MDGLQDETNQGVEGSVQRQPEPQGDGRAQQAAQVEADGDAAKARMDYEAALKERDTKIAELEGQIAEAAKSAESAEKLHAEMAELKRRGEEERVGFELQLAGARNVKAAKALLSDHGGDVEALKEAESWLFGAGAPAPAQTGATGLPNAGAAADEGTQMKRWRRIAGIEGDKE
ncbi:hypothetical protein [Rubneribacter badeniensis]|uniref:hypothetical protein n=1 Tax=Rubneribacter badeniensis TaxID=2070688 RepID=UPI003A8FC221